ncbi:hypothetical protein MRS76_15925 [Rhizobiaceae bacterium n13]|uniref:hypothetical protein n=1 Tax=Ferirhizobium litorale TaxID=2927786 RepID=UPI0024B289DC|nr:hypothetical protein [Fererhizobium litorale]MDI7863445.1 hypothetical protein [Fererhizobium litorale]
MGRTVHYRITTCAGAAAALALLALCTIPDASAADKTEVVKFKAGQSSTTLKGSVKGYDSSNFIVGANRGQTLSVLFSPSNSSCYFNLTAPDAQEAMHIGSIVGNEFAGALPTAGDYTIQTYLMRNAARRNETCTFSMTIEISG